MFTTWHHFGEINASYSPFLNCASLACIGTENLGYVPRNQVPLFLKFLTYTVAQKRRINIRVKYMTHDALVCTMCRELFTGTRMSVDWQFTCSLYFCIILRPGHPLPTSDENQYTQMTSFSPKSARSPVGRSKFSRLLVFLLPVGQIALARWWL